MSIRHIKVPHPVSSRKSSRRYDLIFQYPYKRFRNYISILQGVWGSPSENFEKIGCSFMPSGIYLGDSFDQNRPTLVK